MHGVNSAFWRVTGRPRVRSYLTHHWLGPCVAQNASTVPCRFASTRKPNVSSFQQTDFHAPIQKITHLIRTNRLDEARYLFGKTEQRNTKLWNALINGYVKRREMATARKMFDEMPQRDIVSWNMIISGYVSCSGSGFLEEARCLFDIMPARDIVTWNTVISGYAKNGNMEEALRLFNSMPEPNVVSWNAIVSGFLQNADLENAIKFFERMPVRNSASLSALVSGLVQNGELDEAARVLVERASQFDGKVDLVHAYNTLIAGYGQRGRVGEARKLFDQIPVNCDRTERNARVKRNIISWNSMIMCYVKAGDVVSARILFDQMVARDTFSWNTMISGYIHVSDMEEALNLVSKMPDPDTLTWNAMISGYSQIGNLELAFDFFKRMPQKNLVSWNSMIAGCETNKNNEGAIEFFIKMRIEGEKPDRHTLSSILRVSTEIVDLHLGMQIHQLVTKTVVPDVPINNALITMYARCGAIVEARIIFEEMKLLKHVVSWNAMIGGYTSHGFAAEALQLFRLMKSFKVFPTYVTFISVLSACAHAGLVEEGCQHFKSMVNEYGIEPRVEHFASLVDLVGRHGRLEDAMDLISGMPCEPDKAVWGALLGACRVHNNVELAQVAAEALIKLEPESSSPYVLLHNMYVDVGQWDEANEVKMRMQNNRIKKPTGYSWVDSSGS